MPPEGGERRRGQVGTDRADPQGGPVQHDRGAALLRGSEVTEGEFAVHEDLRQPGQPPHQVTAPVPERRNPRVYVQSGPVQVADRDALGSRRQQAQ
ncbi:hypothetical protein GCM10009733_098520 [Nonomuraea maheshkhaliensis]|uniref:Uncharacterized protein n=1 Tax=Nonomuraea maheshkhaliensis TaxID=419590 RepID=A0ABP4TD33_9ACTN